MKNDVKILKQKIIQSLINQGFTINPHLELKNNNKEILRNVHFNKKIEQLKLHSNFIKKNFTKIKKHISNIYTDYAVMINNLLQVELKINF